ncbi:MAG: hypothetical protein HY849_05755 [Nitrosomonadales bacterium]|nr:hypothetical protein [Nitrosomonadales bacterium]
MQITEQQTPPPIYYIMSDQPDCCGKCGSRLDLAEIRVIDGESVFVTSCGECHREVLIVEN